MLKLSTMGNNLQYYSSLDLTDYKSERKLGWRQRTRTLNPASVSSVHPSKALDLPAPPILNLKTEYVELAVILRFFRGILLNNSMFDLFFSENKSKMGVKLPINCISIYEFWAIPGLHCPELALKTKAGLSRRYSRAVGVLAADSLQLSLSQGINLRCRGLTGNKHFFPRKK